MKRNNRVILFEGILVCLVGACVGCSSDDAGPSNAEQVKASVTQPSNNPQLGTVDARNKMGSLGKGGPPKMPPSGSAPAGGTPPVAPPNTTG